MAYIYQYEGTKVQLKSYVGKTKGHGHKVNDLYILLSTERAQLVEYSYQI